MGASELMSSPAACPSAEALNTASAWEGREQELLLLDRQRMDAVLRQNGLKPGRSGLVRSGDEAAWRVLEATPDGGPGQRGGEQPHGGSGKETDWERQLRERRLWERQLQPWLNEALSPSLGDGGQPPSGRWREIAGDSARWREMAGDCRR